MEGKFRLILYFVISFCLGTIVLFYNASKIPAGDELGGLAEFFLCVFYAVIIYLFNIGLSVIVWKLSGSKKYILLLLIHSLSVCLIYYSSWNVCIYRPSPLTEKELADQKIIELQKLNKLLIKIPKLIRKGDVFKPQPFVCKTDSLKVSNALDSLFNIPYSSMDSTTKNKIADLIDFNSYTIFRDPGFTIPYLNSIKSSIRVKELYYSPSNQVLLSVITFNTVDGGDALILIGRKIENRLLVYKYYHYQYPDYPNADIAYSACFKYVNGIGDRYLKYPSFLKKEFWLYPDLFEKYNYKNSYLFNFQIEKHDGKNRILPKVPIFDILFR
jgi:hypothetical protein